MRTKGLLFLQLRRRSYQHRRSFRASGEASQFAHITVRPKQKLHVLIFLYFAFAPNINMESETQAVTLVGFRRLSRVNEAERGLGSEHRLINLAILDYGGSAEDRQRMKEVELWARAKSEDVRLCKVPRPEAFLDTYRDLLRSSLRTFFLTSLSVEQIPKEPLQLYYNQHILESQTLNEANREIEDNLRKVAFIILRDSLQGIHKCNYFHANVALITSSPAIVLQHFQENLKILIRLRPAESSSSVNSEDAQHFQEELHTMTKAIVVHQNEQSQLSPSKDCEAMKLLNNTPGVGSYNIQGQRT